MDGSHRGSIDPIRLCDLTSVSLVLSEKEYSIRGGLSRGRGLNAHDGLLGLLLAHTSVWMIKNDRILNSSAQRIRDGKRNISTDKINIKNYLKNRGYSCSIKTIMKNILKP